VVEVRRPISYWTVNGFAHDLILNRDCKLRTVSKRKASFILETSWHNAIVQFERVAKIVNVEQFWGQRIAAIMALAL
jgi:hypothetical protein